MVLVFYCSRPVSHSGLPQDESHVQRFSTSVQTQILCFELVWNNFERVIRPEKTSVLNWCGIFLNV